MSPDYLLQTGNNPVALAEWFVASIALIIVVTLVYIFVLNRSPPPEGVTQAKVESSHDIVTQPDAGALLLEAQNSLKVGNTNATLELSVRAASAMLGSVLSSMGINSSNMNITDMAYLVQGRSPASPDITQPLYQLNLLRLRSAQSQPMSPQEAEWSVNVVTWLSQLIANRQIAS